MDLSLGLGRFFRGEMASHSSILLGEQLATEELPASHNPWAKKSQTQLSMHEHIRQQQSVSRREHIKWMTDPEIIQSEENKLSIHVRMKRVTGFI